MAKRKTTYRIGTGATSLLMVLVILCLTALSVVSYTAANSERKLARRTSEVTLAVREAENEAQRMLAVIDGKIAQARKDSADDDAMLTALDDLLSDTDVTRDDRTLSFTLPATENLSLWVTLEVGLLADDARYTVTGYATQSEAAGFDETEMLDLFQ